MSDQENLIRKLQSENESGRATISQLKERVALLESSRAKEAQTADAMIGLEKATRDELERFKKDWSALRSESGVFEREIKELRDDVKRLSAGYWRAFITGQQQEPSPPPPEPTSWPNCAGCATYFPWSKSTKRCVIRNILPRQMA